VVKVLVIGAPWADTAPGEVPEKGEYLFFSDASRADYDWLAVCDEFPRRGDSPGVKDGKFLLSCPRERTILLTQEPTSVKYYNRVYTSQFGHLLTNRPYEAEKHHHYHLGRGYYVWFVGRSYQEARAWRPGPKTKCISAVYSSKNMRHTLHHARCELLDYLSDHVRGLDRFGKDTRPITHKYEALDEYKYHLAVENHIGMHHWSEKVADALLCETLPFYAGDPALGEVLPKDCFIPIPINDPPRAAKIINGAIAAGEYEKRLPAIREARRLLLDKYNFRDQIIEVIQNSYGQPIVPAEGPQYLLTRKRTRLSLRGACGDLAHHCIRLLSRQL